MTPRITKKTEKAQQASEEKAPHLQKMKIKMTQMTTKMTPTPIEKMNGKMTNWRTRAMTN